MKKKLQPKLRFKEFDGNWKCLKLDSLMEFKNGINANKEAYGNGRKFINVLDILSDKPITYNSIRGSLEVADNIFNKNTVTYGDVLFQRSSETREEVGTANVYIDNENVATFGGFVIRGKKIGEYNPLFMNKLLKTPSARKEITSKSGGSTRYNLSQSTLNEIILRFPSLSEQEKIALFLSSVDNKIEKLEEKKKLLEKYKKGTIQKIFSQEIRFKGKEGENYPDWKVKKGNQIFEAISNKKHNSDLPILSVTQDRGAIPREFIDQNTIVSEKSVASYKVVEVRDFIISLRSFQGGIEYSNYRGICSPAYIILRPNIEIVDYFYQTYLKTYSYIQQLKSKLEGIRDGKMISYKYFSETNIPYPCLEEQDKIVEFLSSIDKKIETVSSEIDEMKGFKKGLLQQMFV